MGNNRQVDQAFALFHTLVVQDRTRQPSTASVPDGGEAPTEVTTPHPYFFVSGDAVLRGELAGAERLAGYQSVVHQGDQVVEAPIAAPDVNDEMSYVASWAPDAASALNNAVRVAEENGRDVSDFAVVTIPEVGFTAVWLRDRHELIPMSIPRTRSGLNPARIYSEKQVIRLLHEPLRERFAVPAGGAYKDGSKTPPSA